MGAKRKIDVMPESLAAAPASPWESMAEPLHPMHQELLRRMTEAQGGAGAVASHSLDRPARLAAIFYLGLAGWVVPASAAYLVYRLL